MPSPSCSVAKHSFPELRAKHHPACDADDLAGLGVGGEVGVRLPQFGERVSAGHLDRVGVAALGKEALPLGLADAELLG